jgi:hypothetical protein
MARFHSSVSTWARQGWKRPVLASVTYYSNCRARHFGALCVAAPKCRMRTSGIPAFVHNELVSPALSARDCRPHFLPFALRDFCIASVLIRYPVGLIFVGLAFTLGSTISSTISRNSPAPRLDSTPGPSTHHGGRRKRGEGGTGGEQRPR